MINPVLKESLLVDDTKKCLVRLRKEADRVRFRKRQVIYAQGDPADAIFFVEKGRVRLTVSSRTGKEATMGILEEGELFGEGGLSVQTMRVGSATAMCQCILLRITKNAMMKIIQREPEIAASFVSYLMARNMRYEEDLIDQLFNNSEKRLARVLLLLGRYDKEDKVYATIPKVSQEILAEMTGTTRSRVNVFMNRFRKLGYIRYNGILQVHRSLLNLLLYD